MMEIELLDLLAQLSIEGYDKWERTTQRRY